MIDTAIQYENFFDGSRLKSFSNGNLIQIKNRNVQMRERLDISVFALIDGLVQTDFFPVETVRHCRTYPVPNSNP